MHLIWQADPVGGLESAVVGDVLPQGVFSIQGLLVDAVVSVLLHHALGLLLEGLHGGVLPPGLQVSVLVELSAFLSGGRALRNALSAVQRRR